MAASVQPRVEGHTEEEKGKEEEEGKGDSQPLEEKDLSLLMNELQSWKMEHEKFVLHFFIKETRSRMVYLRQRKRERERERE